MKMAALVCATATSIAAVWGQAPTVSIVVSMLDSGGRPVVMPAPESLTVTLNQAATAVTFVAPFERPLAIVVVGDRSGSTNPATLSGEPVLATLTAGVVKRGVQASLKPDDYARLGRISDTLTLTPPLSMTDAAWAETVDVMFGSRGYGASPLWDAVVAAGETVRTHEGRRLVVLITDGKSNANKLSLEDAARQLVAGGVGVTAIDIGQSRAVRQDDQSGMVVRPDRALRWLAEATGGFYRALPLRGQQVALETALRETISAYRQAIEIRVQKPSVPGVYSLEVDSRFPDVAVHHQAFVQVR